MTASLRFALVPNKETPEMARDAYYNAKYSGARTKALADLLFALDELGGGHG